MASTITITAFDKVNGNITFTTPMGQTVTIKGLDPDLDDAGLKDLLSSVSNQRDSDLIVPADPLAKVALKVGDSFAPTIVDNV